MKEGLPRDLKEVDPLAEPQVVGQFLDEEARLMTGD